MATTRGVSLIAVLVLSMVPWASMARAEDEDAALRRQALNLNIVTGEDPIKGEIKALLKDPAATKKLLEVATKMAQEKDQPFNYNAAYILARTAQEIKELDAGRTFYRLCVTQATKLLSGQKLADSYGGLIDLLTQHKKFEESVKVCEEFLELPVEGNNMAAVRRLRSPVLGRMIQSLARQGQYDKATKLVDNLLKANPDNWLVLYIKGNVLREAGKHEEAAKTYEEVLDRINKDKSIKDADKEELTEEYRYLLSGVYVDMDQIDKAANELKALLKKKPDNPTYNNDLGYIWADHDMNLEEAEKLIRKALEEDRKLRKTDARLQPEDDRDNAAYLDSLGWVLFKQKKYEEAKKYLLLAAEDKEGQHVEILDHLGDVHKALGEKDRALAIWKKALELDTISKREEQRKLEVEKKIKANR